MKKINWLTVFFWSLIVVGFTLMIMRHLGYDIPRYIGIIIIIGTIGLKEFKSGK